MDYPKVTCTRCKGKKYMLGQEGKVPNYKHNEQGKCFACDGEGTLIKRPDGQLVRRDLNNGNWLSFSLHNGTYLGVVKPLNAVICEEEQILFERFKTEESFPIPEIETCHIDDFVWNEKMTEADKLAGLYLDEFPIDYDDEKPKKEQNSSYESTYVSVAELTRMCNLPEGVGLFDDDM